MLRAPIAALATAAVLSACGGGVFIGVEGGFDDSPPSVSLAAGASSTAAGSTLRLVAAAADESGIARVEFYRLDGNTTVALGTVNRSPWELTITVPADGRTQLQVFARAVDGEGNSADSGVVAVAVVP